MKKSNIHFIVGIWRSGTTLLREILGMSDEVKIFPEHFVLLHHLNKAQNFYHTSKTELLQNVSTNPDFIHFAQPDLNLLKAEFEKANNFENAIKTIYAACLKEGENISTFIDKNPIYSYYLPELIHLFPKAKFIWMVREPKDNCISRAKHDIQTIKNYGYLASWWNLTNERIRVSALQYPEKFLLIPYDIMVENPKPWVIKICAFLGIPFEEKLLAFETKKEERISSFVLAAKARDGEITKEYAAKKKAMWENLQKPINTSKTKQWKTELSLAEIASIDRISKKFYENLIENNLNDSGKTHFIYGNLAKLSLLKLKQDIRFKRIT